MLSAQSNGGTCRTESELRWLPRSFLLISKYLWLPEKVSKERSRVTPALVGSQGISVSLSTKLAKKEDRKLRVASGTSRKGSGWRGLRHGAG